MPVINYNVCFLHLHCQSGRQASLQSCCNPYEARVGGRVLLGTSGQTVDNIRACSSLDDPLHVLNATCSWGHLAPTAPDTLGTFPRAICTRGDLAPSTLGRGAIIKA